MVRIPRIVIVAAFICFVCGLPNLALALTLFEDDFASFDGGKWELAPPDLTHGQTMMDLPPGIDPNGWLVLEHHTYNADPVHTGYWCSSGEIHSFDDFLPTPSQPMVELEARMRFRSEGIEGTVGGLFLYSQKPAPGGSGNPPSDEIDIELVSNQIELYPDHVGHHTIQAAYNDFVGGWYDGVTHWHTNPTVPGLDLTQFNTFLIRWELGRASWVWRPDEGPDVLLGSTTNAVPDEPMALYLNLWASDELWPLAWHSGMGPESDPSKDRVCYLDIDHLAVRAVPEPLMLPMLASGCLALVGSRRR
jgi:hypothetical protein